MTGNGKRFVVTSEERLADRAAKQPLYLGPHGRWGSRRAALRFHSLTEARAAALDASFNTGKRVTIRCGRYEREYDTGLVVWASDNKEYGFERHENLVTPEAAVEAT